MRSIGPVWAQRCWTNRGSFGPFGPCADEGQQSGTARAPRDRRTGAHAWAGAAEAAQGLTGPRAAEGTKTGVSVITITVIAITCIQYFSHWSHAALDFHWLLLAFAGRLATMANADALGLKSCRGLKHSGLQGLKSSERSDHAAVRHLDPWWEAGSMTGGHGDPRGSCHNRRVAPECVAASLGVPCKTLSYRTQVGQYGHKQNA